MSFSSFCITELTVQQAPEMGHAEIATVLLQTEKPSSPSFIYGIEKFAMILQGLHCCFLSRVCGHCEAFVWCCNFECNSIYRSAKYSSQEVTRGRK